MTLLHQAAQKAVEALQLAHAGLEWYRDGSPSYRNGCDDEADEKIGDALVALQSALQQQEEPSRELMEAYEGECSDATFQGFAESRAADKVNSLSRVIYRMGFQSGWEIRGKLAASPSTTRQQEVGSGLGCKFLDDCKNGTRTACMVRGCALAAAPSTPEKAGGVSEPDGAKND